MGCCFSSEREAPLSTAVHVEIEAPIDLVWDIVTDIQALPKIVSYIEHVEFLSRDHHPGADKTQQPTLAVGTRWMETRRFGLDRNARSERQTKTIIKLEPDGPTRALGVNIRFPRRRGGGYEDIINTCTFTVQTMNDRSCVLICSVAFHAAGMNWIPRPCLERIVLKHAYKYLLNEVEDYRKAAVEAFQEISASDSAKNGQ